MKKDAYYFSHDANAHQDPKIMRMLLTMKAEGYGIYWVIIEMLRSEPTLTLGTKDYDAIAYQSHCDCIKVAQIINDFGLFTIKENGDFFSESLVRRVEEYRNKSKKYSENAHKRWQNDAMALQSQCNGNALKERKGKNNTYVELTKKTPIVPTSESGMVKYNTNPSANKSPIHTRIISSFKQMYQLLTGTPYNTDKKDYVLIAGLVKKYGEDIVNQKIKLLHDGCKHKVYWFTKQEGAGAFTISKLSTHWNLLVEVEKKPELMQL